MKVVPKLHSKMLPLAQLLQYLQAKYPLAFWTDDSYSVNHPQFKEYMDHLEVPHENARRNLVGRTDSELAISL